MRGTRARRALVALALVGGAGAVGSSAGSAGAATGSPPQIGIIAPYDGQVFETGSAGHESTFEYTCQDVDLVSCTANAPNHTQLDTSAGAHVLTVTATDAGGNVATRSVTYYGAHATYTCAANLARIGSAAIGSGDPTPATCPTTNVQVLDSTRTLAPVVPPLFGGVFPSVILAGGSWSSGPRGGDANLAGVGLYNQATRQSIEISAITSSAFATPIGGACTGRLDGESSVDGLSIVNGFSSIDLGALGLLGPITQPVTIPLVVGTLYLNQHLEVGHTLLQRAVFLDLPGNAADVALGETKAGLVC